MWNSKETDFPVELVDTIGMSVRNIMGHVEFQSCSRPMLTSCPQSLHLPLIHGIQSTSSDCLRCFKKINSHFGSLFLFIQQISKSE
jgi:hypothetical protein